MNRVIGEFKNEFNDELTVMQDSEDEGCPATMVIYQHGELGCAAGYFLPLDQVRALRDLLTTILEAT